MPTAGGLLIISEEGARVGFSKEICRIDFLVGGTLLVEGGYRDMPTAESLKKSQRKDAPSLSMCTKRA
jgi:hypothetical protein